MNAYFVTARLRRGVQDDLAAKLKSGVLNDVTPFGPALQHALSNACVLDDGRIGFEVFHCGQPPLQEEREYTLDWYFYDFRMALVAPGQGWRQQASAPRLFPALSLPESHPSLYDPASLRYYPAADTSS